MVNAVSIEPVHRGSLKQRFVPSAAVFLAAGVGVYLTVYLALGVLRHIVMPVLAVLVAGWLAQKTWRLTGRRSSRQEERSLAP